MHSMFFNVMINVGLGPRLGHHRNALSSCWLDVWDRVGPFHGNADLLINKYWYVPWSLDPSKHEAWWTTNYFLQIIAEAIAIIDCLSHLHPPLSIMVQHWLGLARLLGVGWTVSFEQIPATAALKSGNTCHLEALRKWRKSHQDLFHAHILDRITIHLSSLVDHPVNLDLSCQLVAWAWNPRWNLSAGCQLMRWFPCPRNFWGSVVWWSRWLRIFSGSIWLHTLQI